MSEIIKGTYVPDQPDGRLPDEFTNYVRITSDGSYRNTTSGDGLDDQEFRVDPSTPAFYSQNTDVGALPPTNNYLICMRTGFKVRVDEGLKQEWNGTLVRAESWEPRHPLDFIKGIPEKPRPSDNPEQPDRHYEDLYPTGVQLSDLDP